MKLTIKKLLAVAMFGSVNCAAIADPNNAKPELKGAYLGQTPPGLKAEVFAPGIISTKGWEYGVVFAPTMKEMYFVREVNADSDPKQEFVVYEQQDEIWKERVISPRVGTPTLSTDNKILFFGRGYNLEYITENFKNTLVLATEVGKIYCNEETGESYPEIIKAIQRRIKRAILNNVQLV